MDKKINLDEFIDDMPFAVAGYRTKIKAEMITFGYELLELAAENAKIEWISNLSNIESEHYIINKQSILDTIKQVE